MSDFYKNCRGGTLILILLAVLLFSALSFAVTQTGRMGGTISQEKAQLAATRLIEWAGLINAAVTRLRISGCNFDAIDENTAWGNPATNAGPCNVWDKTNGGGAPWQLVENGDTTIYGDYTNTPFPHKQSFAVNTQDIYGLGTTQLDAVFIVFNIKPEICKAINKQLKIVTGDGEPPLEDTPYEGGWTNPHDTALWNGYNEMTIGIIGALVNSGLTGKRMGCYRADRPGTDMGYHFYSQIIEY